MSPLVDAAKNLQSARIKAIVRDLREPRAAIRRVLILLVYAGLVYFVANDGRSTGLQPEAIRVLPYVIAMLGVSLVWMVALRLARGWQDREWVDVAGSIANFAGVAVLLRVGWNVMLPFVATLPLSCITIGALHRRAAFFASIGVSVLIVYSSAPSGYWGSRPFVGALALALLVGLPLTIIRLMLGLREVSIEAIKARNAQSRFLATMSHELRTPLNSVVSATELLNIEDQPERRRHLMQMLEVNALVLRNRVNDVLDVRAIEAGHLAIVAEPFTFGGLLKMVSNVVSPLAAEKNITLHFNAGKEKDLVLRSDPGRLEQILTNLCSNAVKFTPEGGRIEVSVETWSVTGDDSRVNTVMTVTDNGIGIREDLKKKIFDPFYQASAGVARASEGVGLGLYIIASITKLMGGAIDVHDAAGGGSVFNIVLQIEKAAAHERPSLELEQREALANHRRTVRSLRCLVVDDNQSNREIMARTLQLAGHTMIAAKSADEALRLFESDKFDAMFLDLHMPGRSGWSVLEHYEEQRRQGRKIPPIVVVSADANPEATQSAHEKGALAFLLKPVSIARMLKTLATIGSGVTRTKRPEPAEPAAMAWIDYLRAEGDPKTLAHFINTCFAGVDKSLAALFKARDNADVKACRQHVHELKNEFLHLAFHEGVGACKEFSQRAEAGELGPAVDDMAELAADIKARLRSEAGAQPVTG
ncbi:MAG: ATP-binding protein [Rudaea sp.]